MLEIIVKIHVCVQRLRVDRRAVTALEYAMIAALVGMVVVTAMTGMGKGFAATINLSASEL